MNKCMKRATPQDIQYIREIYVECKSIEKTAALTKWTIVTVAKYVSDLSCKYPSSLYNHRHIYKLDKNTGKILMEYQNLATAARLTHLSISNINKCVKGHTKTAGGFCWSYKDNYEHQKFIPPKHTFYSESKFIDRLLFC